MFEINHGAISKKEVHGLIILLLKEIFKKENFRFLKINLKLTFLNGSLERTFRKFEKYVCVIKRMNRVRSVEERAFFEIFRIAAPLNNIFRGSEQSFVIIFRETPILGRGFQK